MADRTGQGLLRDGTAAGRPADRRARCGNRHPGRGGNGVCGRRWHPHRQRCHVQGGLGGQFPAAIRPVRPRGQHGSCEQLGRRQHGRQQRLLEPAGGRTRATALHATSGQHPAQHPGGERQRGPLPGRHDHRRGRRPGDQGREGAQFPILSPDRGTVVYLQAGDKNQLRTAAVDGTGDRPLFPSTPDGCESVLRPAWNPVDPSELAIACVTSDGTTELKLVGVDGTLRVTLNPGIPRFDDLSFSPDGKYLVYWGSQSKNGDGGPLFLQPADGSGLPRQITIPGGANDADPVFSPDGTTIYFRRATTSSSQIISVHTDERAWRRCPTARPPTRTRQCRRTVSRSHSRATATTRRGRPTPRSG